MTPRQKQRRNKRTSGRTSLLGDLRSPPSSISPEQASAELGNFYRGRRREVARSKLDRTLSATAATETSAPEEEAVDVGGDSSAALTVHRRGLGQDTTQLQSAQSRQKKQASIPSLEIGQLPSSTFRAESGSENPRSQISTPLKTRRGGAGADLSGNPSVIITYGGVGNEISDDSSASGRVNITPHSCDASNPAPRDHNAWVKHFQERNPSLPHHHYFWCERGGPSRARSRQAGQKGGRHRQGSAHKYIDAS